MISNITPPPVPTRLPRAVLFDWDNTLVTNWRCIHASINAALADFSLPLWTLDESYERVRHSLRDSFPLIFGEDWPRARDIFYTHFEKHHLNYLDVLPGAAELLALLRRRGVTLCVVSNKTGRFLRREAEMLGWASHFTALVGANDAAADKPAAAPVTLALTGTGIEPGPDVWFIGDADVDMECAHRTGCTPILVGHTPAVGEGLRHFPPALRLDSCAAISSLVSTFDDTIYGDAGMDR
jgi:phosphoglycolate phosphatase